MRRASMDVGLALDVGRLIAVCAAIAYILSKLH